jgi:hypothetical protein
MRKVATTILGVLGLVAGGFSQTLDLPPRPADSPGGLTFARNLLTLSPEKREEKIIAEIARGNVPEFLRKLRPVTNSIDSKNNSHTVVYYVTPDYLAVGSDSDYFLTPLSAVSARRVADLLGCTLPTRRMVDQIYAAAELKLAATPVDLGSAATNFDLFIVHNSMISAQRREQFALHPPGALTAGEKADVVISAKFPAQGGKSAVYGWQKSDGKAVQPLSLEHPDTWTEYNQGVRLVRKEMIRDGIPAKVPEILKDGYLAVLLSDEGPVERPRSTIKVIEKPAQHPPQNEVFALVTKTSNSVSVVENNASDKRNSLIPPFGENSVTFKWEPDLTVSINAPLNVRMLTRMDLIFYALPDNVSLEQSSELPGQSKDDGNSCIQKIRAQTRFLRSLAKDHSVVVVCIQAGEGGWSEWMKKHNDHPELISQLVASVKSRFKENVLSISLGGQGEGGDAVFEYINGVTNIPSEMKRIVFIGGNRSYEESAGHCKKLMDWLADTEDHYLSVMACQDEMFNPLVETPAPVEKGAWGKSHAMIADLGRDLIFSSVTNGILESSTAMRGRVRFLLLENFDRRITDTDVVERNGFIQSMLSGTESEGRHYEFFGPRAYGNYLAVN